MKVRRAWQGRWHVRGLSRWEYLGLLSTPCGRSNDQAIVRGEGLPRSVALCTATSALGRSEPSRERVLAVLANKVVQAVARE
jgi:hypothetical protein